MSDLETSMRKIFAWADHQLTDGSADDAQSALEQIRDEAKAAIFQYQGFRAKAYLDNLDRQRDAQDVYNELVSQEKAMAEIATIAQKHGMYKP